MQTLSQPEVAHVIESAGVDWITATAQKGSTRWDMSQYARAERERLMDYEIPIKQSYRLGYDGWSAEGFFHGQREGGTIIVASGAVAHRVFKNVAACSDHISRLDLQTTISLPTERPHLGIQAFSMLRAGVPSKVKVKNVCIIESSPAGETCTIGKRSSDCYGRIYDKATEAQLGPARSVWRYEVEFKRRAAMAAAADLRRGLPAESVARSLVHDWYSARGVAPVFQKDVSFCPQKPERADVKRNVLTWFEESLSITIAKAVHRYGRERVLEALGLSSGDSVK
jgi:hypothetical protein